MRTSVVIIHQAKTNLSRLLRKASNGEEVVISRGSKPAAERPSMLEWLERTQQARPIAALEVALRSYVGYKNRSDRRDASIVVELLTNGQLAANSICNQIPLFGCSKKRFMAAAGAERFGVAGMAKEKFLVSECLSR